jgi:hypothetical protein
MESLNPDEQRILRFLQQGRSQGAAPGRGTRRQRPREVSPEPGTIAWEIHHREPEIEVETAKHHAVLRARSLMADARGVAAWLDAELRSDEYALAERFNQAGITSAMLGIKIRRETILERYRVHGYSIQDLVTTLKTEGLWPAA